MQDWESVFHLTFRKEPFGSGFSIACGLESLVDVVRQFRYSASDLNYLATLKSQDGSPLFSSDFIGYLEKLKLTVDIDAMPEGTVAFPHEPLVRVKGPLLQCQLLETILLNVVGFQTLIATKAARISLAAKGEPVLEFGARRAQGVDGAMSAARAAYVGGCDATSNVLAGKTFGIPVQGTHAHSWVMAFDNELAAFEAYAETMPSNVIFLVDTYDTIQGVKHAIEVGQKLKARGHSLLGVRLDSGDLDSLSRAARKLLDEAGFEETKILATNDLNEDIIASLKEQGSKISVWGVGTQLVTGGSEASLGVVYKLSALRKPGEKEWLPKIKLSEQPAKISIPGIQQVRRFEDATGFIQDAIFDENLGCDDTGVGISLVDPTRREVIPQKAGHQDLLVPILRKGELHSPLPSLTEIREHRKSQMARLTPSLKRFVNPHVYPVTLDAKLYSLRSDLILKERGYVNS